MSVIFQGYINNKYRRDFIYFNNYKTMQVPRVRVLYVYKEKHKII